MLKAKQGKEIVLRAADEIGVLAKLSKIVADKGVNILAMSCWVEESEGVIHLVTDDNLRASDALRKHGYDPKEDDVVMIEARHKPGMLRHIAETLAHERIDIRHLYASATLTQEVCLVVLKAEDHDRAVVLLND